MRVGGQPSQRLVVRIPLRQGINGHAWRYVEAVAIAQQIAATKRRGRLAVSWTSLGVHFHLRPGGECACFGPFTVRNLAQRSGIPSVPPWRSWWGESSPPPP